MTKDMPRLGKKIGVIRRSYGTPVILLLIGAGLIWIALKENPRGFQTFAYGVLAIVLIIVGTAVLRMQMKSPIRIYEHGIVVDKRSFITTLPIGGKYIQNMAGALAAPKTILFSEITEIEYTGTWNRKPRGVRYSVQIHCALSGGGITLPLLGSQYIRLLERVHEMAEEQDVPETFSNKYSQNYARKKGWI